MSDAAPLGEGSRTLALRTADGLGLRGAVIEGTGRGVALLFQGRTEFCEKYAPVAAELRARGFAVATADWRGQGASDRPVGHPRKGHVDDFAEYQADVDALLAATAALPGPRLLVAHSMGGAIALRALLRLPGLAEAVVFSAPMWGFGGRRSLSTIGRALAWAGVGLGLSRRYAPLGGDATYALTEPEPNVLTADPEQAAWIAETTRANIGKALGGPTLGWLRAAFREMDALAPLPTPRRALVVAGTAEAVVSLAAIRARAERDGLDVTEIDGARHEPFFESPERRRAMWAAMDAHLAANRL